LWNGALDRIIRWMQPVADRVADMLVGAMAQEEDYHLSGADGTISPATEKGELISILVSCLVGMTGVAIWCAFVLCFRRGCDSLARYGTG
jgi:hypothetical protein